MYKSSINKIIHLIPLFLFLWGDNFGKRFGGLFPLLISNNYFEEEENKTQYLLQQLLFLGVRRGHPFNTPAQVLITLLACFEHSRYFYFLFPKETKLMQSYYHIQCGWM